MFDHHLLQSIRRLGIPLGLLAAAAAGAAAPSAIWQQAGGSLFQVSTQVGIVGQGYETPSMSSASVQVQSGFLANPLLKNNPPYVSSPLPDLTKDAGFSAYAIALDAVFADIDGDALAFFVKTSGTALTASIHSDSLVLAGVASNVGTQTLVVGATDGSDTVSDTFQMVAQVPSSLVARPARHSKSTDLSVSIPRAMASAALGTGRGRLDADFEAEGENVLSLNIVLPAPATVSVSIFDNLGNPIISYEREVTQAELWRLNRTPDFRWILPVSWNLRTRDGTPVGTGVYLWKAVVQTEDGQKLETIRRLGVKGSP